MDVTQLLLCHGERKLPNDEDSVQVGTYQLSNSTIFVPVHWVSALVVFTQEHNKKIYTDQHQQDCGLSDMIIHPAQGSR